MSPSSARSFDLEDQFTWAEILSLHKTKREKQACDIFLKGIEILGIDAASIPDLEEINRTLERISGFRGVYVDGLEEGASFFKMLAQRKFPVGNFVRSRKDLNYTPAPDLIHDLYGHLPFFTDRKYADFCRAFGEEAGKYVDQPELLRQFERFFWFTIEFGLVQTAKGPRIFGAGIVSSLGECEYSLSGRPEILPFDVDRIRGQEFRIDILQPKLFCLENAEQLYECLPELSRKIQESTGARNAPVRGIE